MSDNQDHQSQERVEEAGQNPAESTPKNDEHPEQLASSPEKDDDSPEVAYHANKEQMNTIATAPNNEYESMRASNGFKPNNTHGAFNPRNTFHARSTDRSSGHGMKHYARLSGNWNERFHVSPSVGNKKSHIYYKQFFGKPTRSNERILLRPKKTVDPYIENETKSRIPKYSKLFRERDVNKEMGWVDNFSVTHSKNNTQLHPKFKEYFDKPVKYNGLVTVATTKGVGDIPSTQKISTHKPTSTIHYLVEDRNNKYRQHNAVKR